MFHLPPLPSQTGMLPMPGQDSNAPPPGQGKPAPAPSPEEIAGDGVDPLQPVTKPKPPPNPLTGEQAPASF
jgi:hypothetical protein